jgi:hypothetical protein
LNITYSPPTQGQVSPLVSYRPDLVPGGPIYAHTGNPIFYLNPLTGPNPAFTLPSYTQPFGNEGRNIAHMPFFNELDFGLHKNFKLWSESRYVQFRAEAFNLLNTVNFAPPSTLSVNSSGYGVFTSAFPSRQIQLALKLYF